MSSHRCALIVGAGTGTGAELARLLAAEGFGLVLSRRDADALQVLCTQIEATGGQALPVAADAADEDSVTALFDAAEREFGPPELVVYNAAGITMGQTVDTSLAEFEDMWNASARGGFLVGREAARRMLPQGAGTILFVGATASVKSGAGFAAFASGKHGLRAVAGSLARELGPSGIHVGHLIIDGIIDVPRVRERMPELVHEKGDGGLIDPRNIAATLLWLHRQPRDAWTFELDLRPFKEPW
jgi:NAD(P)-dependent dehydrogenase (short-subunit alcohol dehydrogenase family)